MEENNYSRKFRFVGNPNTWVPKLTYNEIYDVESLRTATYRSHFSLEEMWILFEMLLLDKREFIEVKYREFEPIELSKIITENGKV